MASKIILLPGDGIGPEIIAPALEVLSAVGTSFDYEEHAFGGASIDAHGTALTDETLAACQAADAVLLAAVGGPKWDTTDPSKPRPEQGLLGLRKGLGPVREPAPGAAAAGALRRQPAQARGDRRAPTCSSCASSPAASTSARRRAPTTTPATSAPTAARRSSGSRGLPSRRRAARSRASTRRT